MRRSACIVLLAAAVLAALAAPASSELLIATEERPTNVKTYEDVLGWSSYDAAVGAYRLRFRRGDRSWTPRVPPRTVPFDLDLGPGPDGKVVAVYSRCREEGDSSYPAPIGLPLYGGGQGCDVYRLRIAGGRERRVAFASSRRWVEVLPTIWRDRLVFARRRESASAAKSYAPLTRLVELRRERIHRLGAGTTGGASERTADSFGPGPTSVDLRGSKLLYTWTSLSSGCAPNETESRPLPTYISEVWIDDLRGQRVLADKACNFDGLGSPEFFFSAGWDGSHAQYGVDMNVSRRPDVAVRRTTYELRRYEQLDSWVVASSLAPLDSGVVLVRDSLEERADRAQIVTFSGPSAAVTPYPTQAGYGHARGYRGR